MRSVAAALVLASATSFTLINALPEISIQKRDRHTNGRTQDVARGVHLKRGGGTLETNVFDILTYTVGGAYYANITVGTPPQPQTVVVDTGSSDLLLDATNSTACESAGSHACRGGDFDPDKSSTFKLVKGSAKAPAFLTAFGDGSKEAGPYALDTVTIGDVSLQNAQFGVATTADSSTGYSVGILGVGYSRNEAVFSGLERDLYPNIPEELVRAGVINSRLYSIYLNDGEASTGSILFGGIDTEKYTGPLQTVNLLPDPSSSPQGVVDRFITAITGLSVNVGGKQTTIFQNGPTGIKAFPPEPQINVIGLLRKILRSNVARILGSIFGGNSGGSRSGPRDGNRSGPRGGHRPNNGGVNRPEKRGDNGGVNGAGNGGGNRGDQRGNKRGGKRGNKRGNKHSGKRGNRRDGNRGKNRGGPTTANNVVNSGDITHNPVLLDTGSAAWAVSPTLFSVILSHFTYVQNANGTGVTPCKNRYSGDSITVTFDNAIDILVPVADFILPIYNHLTNEPLKQKGEDMCVFMIVGQSLDTPPESTLQFRPAGDAILRAMYVVYDMDNGQMALAQANPNNTRSNIVTVEKGPNGIAKAARNVKTTVANTFTIAPTDPNAVATEARPTATTNKVTVGDATGTAAVPANGQPGNNPNVSKSPMTSAGSGSSSGSGHGGSSSTSSSAKSMASASPTTKKSGGRHAFKRSPSGVASSVGLISTGVAISLTL